MKAISITLTVLAVVMGLSFVTAVILDNVIFIVIAFGCFVSMLLTCIVWEHIDARRYRHCDRDICGLEYIV